MAHEEDWETGSGLSLDGARVRVTAMEFGFNANLGAGITCANFTFVNTDDGEEIEQSFSVGKNYEANRDGSSIEGQGKINKNTNYGVLIESVKAIVESPGEAIGSPKEAAGWIGTEWTFGTIEREVQNPTTKETKIASKFVVLEFHGRGDDGKKAGKAAAKSSSASKTSSSSKSSGGDVNGIDAELWAKLVELAGEHDEHDDFVNAALDLPEVEASKAAQKAVMGSKAGSVWAAKG